MPSDRLKVLVVAAEVAPFAKVGGLADVAAALPKALRAVGHDVRVAMPAYAMIAANPRYAVRDLLPAFSVHLGPSDARAAHVRATTLGDDIPVYLVGGHPAFARAGRSEDVYSLDYDPYVFFCKAVAEMVPLLEPAWRPDVVHCNDWHTGLLPVFLDVNHEATPAWQGAGRVFTIHNLAYQGTFDRTVMKRAGLPDHLYNMHDLEFYGQVNMLKGGLVHSHRANTVSRTYAVEIQGSEYGCGLDGLLARMADQGRLTGIVNGIDFDEFDPQSDPRTAAPFSAADPSGKQVCRAALQAECGLAPDPGRMVVGLVSRLADQKGLDLIEAAADRLLSLPIQLVVLGTGDHHYEAMFQELAARRPQQVHARAVFDADFAQRIYAGCDAFLMPSRFEPCGLGQLISLRYGTIPIVRATGGLVDTVFDADAHPEEGNGFVFGEYSDARLLGAVTRALEAFREQDRWAVLVQRALAADNSWTRSAHAYETLYESARAAAVRAYR